MSELEERRFKNNKRKIAELKQSYKEKNIKSY